MSEWYVRDRGQVIGPFTTDELLDIKDRGLVKGYHEVSTDRQRWKAMDLIPELGNVPHHPHRPAQSGRRLRTALWWGGAVGIVVFGCAILIAIMILRN